MAPTLSPEAWRKWERQWLHSLRFSEFLLACDLQTLVRIVEHVATMWYEKDEGDADEDADSYRGDDDDEDSEGEDEDEDAEKPMTNRHKLAVVAKAIAARMPRMPAAPANRTRTAALRAMDGNQLAEAVETASRAWKHAVKQWHGQDAVEERAAAAPELMLTLKEVLRRRW